MGNVPKVPLGVRRNNPGNIDFNPACIWVGQVMPHDGHRFCQFKGPEYGVRAMAKLLTNYRLKKHIDGTPIDTLYKAVWRWAPPVENHSDIYAKFVAARCDCGADEKVDFTQPEFLFHMIKAMIRMENGYEPYDDSIIKKGIALLKS
jgi:hypothetical protein